MHQTICNFCVSIRRNDNNVEHHADFLRVSIYPGADLPTIAKELAPATKLQWLVLRTADIVGQLSCDIILPSLELLSLTRNGLTVS